MKKNLIVMLIIFGGIIIFFISTKEGKMYLDVTQILINGIKVNLEDNFEEFEGVNEKLDNYDVYLTGEAHGTEFTYKMQEYMTKYFIENQGVKYIIMEIPVSVAELLNMYLENGDKRIIEVLLQEAYGTYSYNQNTYDLFNFYYEYNKSLPVDKRFKIIGIDKEQNLLTTIKYLKFLIKDLDEPNDKIKEVIYRINGFSNYNDEQLFNDLCNSVAMNSKEYEEYLGENFFYFNMVVKNIIMNSNETKREKAMIENFKCYYERLPKGKYFGQLGGAHVYKGVRDKYLYGEKPFDTFANSINNDYTPLKGKVYSIIYLYMNSYANENGQRDILGGRGIYIPYFECKGSVRLYDRDKQYKSYEILEDNKFSQEELGDMFFLIKDSKACGNYKQE